LQTHPLAPPPTFLPAEIQQLFARAFTDGLRDPASRPSAAEWRDSLLRLQLTTCSSGTHRVPVGTARCPWCAISEERLARRGAPTGPRPVVRAAPAVRPASTFGVSTNIVVAGLISVSVIVAILAAFIVWAILSGASTFGV
ncbi:hypothetical protein BST34_09495, partial [Mycolicibacterium monacense DSM 44395]